ncbi:MAG: hypothetical protein CVV25_02495 [Ignavibacteriae bacterium HGW-Ignavibacteriae-4]|jgi:hypothetical protein|nr:MAG: hypothetical protein CVV25_02495 [Ignavibacteriae bacterium HGW-Ignavibacteriae-4]
MKYIIFLLFIALSTSAIAQFRIDYPTGGEKLQAGSEVVIWWRDYMFYGDEMARVEFSPNNGKDWTILDPYSANDRYKWTVPNIISDSCLVKATQITDIQYKPPVLWSKSYGGKINSMNPTTDGGFIAVGDKDGNGWVMKLDSIGEIVWTKSYGTN